MNFALIHPDRRMLINLIGRRRCLVIAPAVLLVLVLGCTRGGAVPAGHISGKVTFQGEPVREGNVHFVSAKGFGASAPLAEDGNYVVKSHLGAQIPLGDYEVSVTPVMLPAPEGTETPPEWKSSPDIPERYRSFKTSGMTFTIKKGNNQYDIEMLADSK